MTTKKKAVPVEPTDSDDSENEFDAKGEIDSLKELTTDVKTAVKEFAADAVMHDELKDSLKKFEADHSAATDKLNQRIDKLSANFAGPSGITIKAEYDGAQGLTRFVKDIYHATKKGRPVFSETLTKYQAHIENTYEQNVSIDEDGGHLIPTEHRNEIMKLVVEGSELLQRVRKLPVQRNSIEIPRLQITSLASEGGAGGVRAFWEAEAATATASDLQFGMIEMKLNKLFAFASATSEMISDSPVTIAALLRDAFATAVMIKLEDVILNGSGAGQPLGLLLDPALVTVGIEDGQDDTTVVFENISKMWSRLWSKSRPNAIWIHNQDVEPQLDALALNVGTGGVSAYLPPNGLVDSPFGRLKGRPVIAVEHCQTLGDKGDIFLIDLSQYLWISKGSEFAESMHLYFDSDRMAYRMTIRVDGAGWWPSKLTPAQGSNTLSPFVTLAARP